MLLVTHRDAADPLGKLHVIEMEGRQGDSLFADISYDRDCKLFHSSESGSSSGSVYHQRFCDPEWLSPAGAPDWVELQRGYCSTVQCCAQGSLS